MTPSFETRSRTGFSVVELMIVIAMIGLVASLALPKFQAFIAKARRAEAVTNLNSLHALFIPWREELTFDIYSGATYPVDFNGPLIMPGPAPPIMSFGPSASGGNDCLPNPLGFQVEDCSKLRYLYNYIPFGTDDTSFFQAFSNHVMPNCGIMDRDRFYDDGHVALVVDAVALCP